MKKILMLLWVSVILISCETENIIIKENTGVPLIREVLIDGDSYYVYTYSVSNLISEEKSKYQYTRHNYNDKNQLISSDYYYDFAMLSSSFVVHSAMQRNDWLDPDNFDVSLTKEYEYEENGKLIRVRYIRPAQDISEYTEFIIEDGMIRKQSMYRQEELSHYIDYTYDIKGNLLKAEKYQVLPGGEAKWLTTNEYEYDEMINPFQTFRRLITPGKFTNPNNITKETYTGNSGTEPFVSVYSYEYNYMGYPVKVNGGTEYVYRW